MPDPDPPPRPPVAPDPADCCGEGCANCVYDIHEAALQRYREALEAWRMRQQGVGGTRDRAGRDDD